MRKHNEELEVPGKEESEVPANFGGQKRFRMPLLKSDPCVRDDVSALVFFFGGVVLKIRIVF